MDDNNFTLVMTRDEKYDYITPCRWDADKKHFVSCTTGEIIELSRVVYVPMDRGANEN